MLNFVYFGSVADPERDYHLEFVYEERSEAEGVLSLLTARGYPAGLTERKRRFVVYLKDGDAIADFLGLVGAHEALMRFENARILREMRGGIQRRVNCETANLQKTVSASVRQTEDILYIRDHMGFEALPDSLKELAVLRLARPDATLSELAAALSDPIGRSGVNHRMRRLSQIAEELREDRA